MTILSPPPPHLSTPSTWALNRTTNTIPGVINLAPRWAVLIPLVTAQEPATHHQRTRLRHLRTDRRRPVVAICLTHRSYQYQGL